MVEFCKRVSGAARVDKVDVHIEEARNEFEGFEVRH